MPHHAIRTIRRIAVLLFLLVLLLAGSLPVGAGTTTLSPPVVELTMNRQEIAWSGAAGDSLWSNPGNWAGGRVPGPGDTVRLRGPAPDARADAAFGGVVGGLVLEADYAGTLLLERALRVRGDLELAGGTLQGGAAGLDVEGAVRVRGGLLVTPAGATMNVVTLDIAAPGVVRLGANGKLNLSGGGRPLTGDGLLDTTTYRPNSVEYTGAATADLTAAGPAAGLRAALPDGFSRVDALTLNEGENGLYCATIDPAEGYAYFGTFTNPGIVVKVDLATFTRVGALALNVGEPYLISAVIDPAGGYAYFGMSAHPGKVVRVDLGTFTHAGTLTFNTGENRANTAVIDPAGGYAYFGTYPVSPGDPTFVVQVGLDPFTRTAALMLNTGESDLRSAVIDPAAGYAYFGTRTSPGLVVQVDLDPFTRTAALTLNAGEDNLHTAVIDPDAGYAYFGTWTRPGSVVQVDLDAFTRTGALALNDGEDFVSAAVIDPAGGYAYFGTFTNPGHVVQVDLAALTRAGALTLNTGEDYLISAQIDPDAGYAYFGTGTYPGIVVKIGVGAGGGWKLYLPVIVRNY